MTGRKKQTPLRAAATRKTPQCVSTPTAILDPREVRGRLSREAADAWRMVLGMEYVYHPRGISFAQLANNADLGNINQMTVNLWAKKDRWVERRRRFIELVRRRVERDIASQIVQRRVETLKRLEKMHAELAKKIEDEMLTVPLKSLEGATTALLRLGDSIDKIRGDVRDVLVGRHPEPEATAEQPEEMQAQPTLQTPARFTPHQIRAMAKAAVKAKWQEREEMNDPEMDAEVEKRAAEITRPKKRPPPPAGDGPEPKKDP